MLLKWWRRRRRPSPAEGGPELVFFGGKGGVGKTTCAAAWAIDSAERALRTLVVSTDPAHSLGDVLQRPLAAHRRRIMPGLDALELSPDQALRDYLAEVRANLRALVAPELRQLALEQVDAAAHAPGCEEAALLDALARTVLDVGPEYDLVVFDTAPSGHTLQLLTLPETMATWSERMLAQRRESRSQWLERRPAVEPAAEDRLATVLARRQQRYARLRARLHDQDGCQFIAVLNPDTLSLAETERLLDQLRDQRIHVQRIIINQVVSADAKGDYGERVRALQAEALRRIRQRFGHLVLTELPQQTSRLEGIAALRALRLRQKADC